MSITLRIHVHPFIRASQYHRTVYITGLDILSLYVYHIGLIYSIKLDIVLNP